MLAQGLLGRVGGQNTAWLPSARAEGRWLQSGGCPSHARARSPLRATARTADPSAEGPEGAPRQKGGGGGRGTLQAAVPAGAGAAPGSGRQGAKKAPAQPQQPQAQQQPQQAQQAEAQQPSDAAASARQQRAQRVQEELRRLEAAQVQPEHGNGLGGPQTKRALLGLAAPGRAGRAARKAGGGGGAPAEEERTGGAAAAEGNGRPGAKKGTAQPQQAQAQQQQHGEGQAGGQELQQRPGRLQQAQGQVATAAGTQPAGGLARRRGPLFGPTGGDNTEAAAAEGEAAAAAAAAGHPLAAVEAAAPAAGSAAAPHPPAPHLLQRRQTPQAGPATAAPAAAAASAPAPPRPAPARGTAAAPAAGPRGVAALEARPPAAGPPGAAAPAAGPPVHVLWDLDNKYPIVLDHRRVVANIRRALQSYGRVVAIRAYCNFHTLNHVPELWQEAEALGMRHPLKEAAPSTLRCPLCGNTFKDEDKMRTHFKKLHEREQKKRMHSVKARIKHAKTEKNARFVAAAKQVMRRPKGFDLLAILEAAGVAVTAVQMGPQAADVALEKDATALLRRAELLQPPPEPPPVLALISDDHGFEPLLQLAAQRGWATVVLSNTRFEQAQAQLEWRQVVGL